MKHRNSLTCNNKERHKHSKHENLICQAKDSYKFQSHLHNDFLNNEERQDTTSLQRYLSTWNDSA